MKITSVTKNAFDIQIQIGEKLESSSSTIFYQEPLTGAKVSYGGGRTANKQSLRLIHVSFPLYRWRISITDQNFVENLNRTNGQQCLDQVLKFVFSELPNDHTQGLLTHTVNLVYDRGVENGRKQKLQEFHDFLEIPGYGPDY